MSASLLTTSSSNVLPISLLIAYKVFSGFVTACLFAGNPTSTSSLSVYAITEGVVLPPSAFSITFCCCPSTTATQLFVVPKSIPIIFDIFFPLIFNHSHSGWSYDSRVQLPASLKYITNASIFFALIFFH